MEEGYQEFRTIEDGGKTSVGNSRRLTREVAMIILLVRLNPSL